MSPREQSSSTKTVQFDFAGMQKQRPVRITGSVHNQFALAGSWMRANLHCHLDRPGKTEWRDTALAHYQRLGYDVVAGMDHDKIVNQISPPPGLIVVPGAEISCGGHLLAIGIDRVPVAGKTGKPAETIVDMIRQVKAAGGIAIIAHPFKSAYTWSELHAFCDAGMDGIEVVNSNVRGKGADTGRADQLWHNLLREGRTLVAIGNDDAHGPHEDLEKNGWGGIPHVGFTGILVTERSPQGVLEAIRGGRTYASEGPEIHAVTVRENGLMTVACSSAVACHFRSVGGNWGGSSSFPTDGQGETREFTFDFTEQGYRVRDYLTVVLQDVHGRRAWTSPIKVDIKVEPAEDD